MAEKLDLSSMMKKAREMQDKLKDIQKQVAETKVWGSAGGGQVKIEMSGNHQAIRCSIEHNLLKEDRSVIEDLIVAAFNDGTNKIEKMLREKMGDLAGASGLV
jgi:nucleoid-associated protein EbfC